MSNHSSHDRAGELPFLVLVLAENNGGKVEKVTLELLGEARKIALAAKGRVEAVLLASPEQSPMAARDLKPFLREPLHLIEHPLLGHYSTDAYLQGLETLLIEIKPSILMLGATANGRDLGPRLAARLGTVYAPNCLAVRVTADGRLDVTRVSHGGRIHAHSSWPKGTRLLMTMKPGVADLPPKQDLKRDLLVQHHVPNIQPSRVRFLEYRPANPKTQDLREAESIVAGGRGVGGPEGFAAVSDLADSLNAAVGASRVAVDLGWIESARQVGQTGKTVAPKLYVAVGISGATHHLMGMRGSEKIVAINKDKKAPIFSVSHFGAVGDFRELVPRLAERIRRHKAEANGAPEGKVAKDLG